MEYVAGAMALVGMVSSVLGARSAKQDAKAAARQEQKLEGIVTAAKVTSLRKEERTLRGDTLAAVAGSNVKTDVGSPLTVLAEQAKTFRSEIGTVKQAGATRAAQAATRGKMAGNAAMYQGFSQAATQGSNAFMMFAKG
jgi:hypothetical protein